jgi:uncharacterized membrane protein YbhN (UPF0104 family)
MNTKRTIKILLSIIMLTVVASSGSFSRLLELVLSISPLTWLFVVVGYTCGQMISSVKWWLIAREGGIATPYSSALRAYFIGMFVNSFGLGLLGGDAARGILISRGMPRKVEGLASVAADRIHGLLVLSFIATMSLFFLDPGQLRGEFAAGLIGIFVTLLLVWIFAPSTLRLLSGRSPRRPLFEKFLRVAEMFPRKPKTFCLITALSFIFHMVQISLHAVMAYAVGASIPWPTLLVIIPIVNIASSLPISWQGLGVREYAYNKFLVPAFLSTEQVVIFGALWLCSIMSMSAIGGVVALLSDDLKVLKAIRSDPEPLSTSLADDPA